MTNTGNILIIYSLEVSNRGVNILCLNCCFGLLKHCSNIYYQTFDKHISGLYIINYYIIVYFVLIKLCTHTRCTYVQNTP